MKSSPTKPDSDSTPQPKESPQALTAAAQIPIVAKVVKPAIAAPTIKILSTKKADSAANDPAVKNGSPSSKELALKAGVKNNSTAEPSTVKATDPDSKSEPEKTDQKKKDETGTVVPMRSLLSHFAIEFCNKIDPLCSPLDNLDKLISDLPKESSLHQVLPDLRDSRHHIQALLEKVKEHQAYVLIFGPLKSGKSTLMNAICASYVSEVTSLPAYPCLVNISYGEKPDYRAVQYDGKTKNFSGQDDLHRTIESAHADLTYKLRDIEGKGEDFDPVVHMPTAFRKIDIKLTTPELATSSAVLVDTPGLYSRMKFGYDQMTRDFRNTAACAIFVVKSDNLFLEQVFEEFTELLELFSRIFLIVNLDSRKMDLNSEGELVPSLEKKNPDKIIEAFRNLAMSAPLKEAVDDGRLCIYPVDLLSAASGRIQADKDGENKPNKENASDQKEANKKDNKDAGSVEQFDKLRGDLINFLNSNDYLKSFLVDSVRRGSSLMTSVQGLVKNPSFAKIKVEVEKLESEKKVLLDESKALANLSSEDWHARSSGLVEELEKKIKDCAESTKKSAGSKIEKSLELWWKEDASLHDLEKTELKPCFEEKAQAYVDEVTELIALKTTNQSAGLEISDSVAGDLKTLKIELRSIVEKSLQPAKPAALTADINLKVGEIPVKKRFFDWLLFRGARRVRKDVFGDEQEPTQAVPANVKEKRLGEAAREVILAQCTEDFAKILDASAASLAKESVTKYVDAIAKNMVEICANKDKENKQALEQKEKLIAANASVLKESTAIDKEVSDIEQFINKSYPLPAWPDNQSTTDSKPQS
ncbi:MAG: GTPase domain-containing protein [Verrucomicrobiota bacterium]